jgi:hypothetical protein
VTKGTLRNDETQKFSIEFKVPKSTASGEYSFSAELCRAGDPKVRLNFRCTLRGSLHIQEHWKLKIRNKNRIGRLPIHFTEPIEFSNLQLEVSDDLSPHFGAKLVAEDGKHFVEVNVSPDQFNDRELLTGQLTIKDRGTGSMSRTEVLIRKSGDLDASPSQLFFRPSAVGEHAGFASVFLEIDKAKSGELPPRMSLAYKQTNADGNSEKQLVIDKFHRLTNSLYRIRFKHIRNGAIEELPESIELRVQFPSSKTMSLEIPCLFQY